MIQYRNVDNWKLINYQGHSIKEVHSSLGKVWPTIPPTPKFYAEYSDSTTYSAACDGDTTLTTATTRAHSTPRMAMTSAVVGDCITTIGGSAFYACGNLESIDIPDSIISIGQSAFWYCSGLTSVEIPSGVSRIEDYTFRYCNGLTSITIPSGVSYIGNRAFANCTSLQSITINAVTPPTLRSVNSFLDTNDCTFYVPCQSVELYKSAWSDYANRIQCIEPPAFDGKWKATYSGGTTSSAQCDSTSAITSGEVETTNLLSLEIGSCVTSIGMQAFENSFSLTSVTIPDSVTTIGNSAFGYCSGLTSLDIPSGVTSIGMYAFQWNINVPSVTIPSGITTIERGTFIDCRSLTSITIPSGVTSIEQHAFDGCSGLTSITVEAPTPPTLGVYVFENTNNAPIYVLPASIETYKLAWSDYSDRIQAIPNV